MDPRMHIAHPKAVRRAFPAELEDDVLGICHTHRCDCLSLLGLSWSTASLWNFAIGTVLSTYMVQCGSQLPQTATEPLKCSLHVSRTEVFHFTYSNEFRFKSSPVAGGSPMG
jgi:hypothetical protein